MKLTLAQIEGFKPCKDRIDNFRNENPGLKEFSIETFLSLDNITYDDKVWVMTRAMTKNQKVRWAIACAWPVLELFENRYHNDKRPRELLEYMNTIGDYSMLKDKEIQKIKELREAAYIAATYAANAAANAANAAANAANAATYAANAAAGTVQQDLNLLLMLEVLKN